MFRQEDTELRLDLHLGRRTLRRLLGRRLPPNGLMARLISRRLSSLGEIALGGQLCAQDGARFGHLCALSLPLPLLGNPGLTADCARNHLLELHLPRRRALRSHGFVNDELPLGRLALLGLLGGQQCPSFRGEERLVEKMDRGGGFAQTYLWGKGAVVSTCMHRIVEVASPKHTDAASDSFLAAPMASCSASVRPSVSINCDLQWRSDVREASRAVLATLSCFCVPSSAWDVCSDLSFVTSSCSLRLAAWPLSFVTSAASSPFSDESAANDDAALARAVPSAIMSPATSARCAAPRRASQSSSSVSGEALGCERRRRAVSTSTGSASAPHGDV